MCKKLTSCHIKIVLNCISLLQGSSRLIFLHLIFKKSLKRFVTEYLPEFRAIYHKCNPFITTVIDGSNF